MIIRSSLSLRSIYIGLIISIVAFLTFFLSYMIGQNSSTEIKNEIGNTLAENSYQTSEKLDNFMWSRYGEIEVLSKLQELKDNKNPSKARELLQQLKSSIPFYSWIGLVDIKGNVRASTDGILEGRNISQRPVFKEGIKGSFIGDVHEAALLAKLLPKPANGPLRFVDISTPLYSEKGKLTGVLASHLSWEWANAVERSILKPLNKKKDIQMFVISKFDDKVLLGPKKFIGTTLHLSSVENAQNGKASWIVEKWPDGKEYITGYVQGKGYMNYKGLGWTVLVRQPLDVAYKPVYNLQQFVLLLGLLCAFVSIFVAWLMAGLVAKPLHKITSVANRLRYGEKVEIPLHKGITEIEILSSALRDLIHSLTKTEKKLSKMESMAHHDALTGLPNRIALDYHLETVLTIAEESDETISILYMDLDHFKPVNDTFGHAVGDALLQQVANRVKNSIRSSDFVARLGGDEFILVLNTPKDNPLDVARAISHNLIDEVQKEYFLNDDIINIGCSIGGAIWPQNGTITNDVIRYADEALYKAKRNGRNRVFFYGTDEQTIRIV